MESNETTGNDPIITKVNVTNDTNNSNEKDIKGLFNMEVNQKSQANQPKTVPKWGGWKTFLSSANDFGNSLKTSAISGIDKIYETLDPGFKVESEKSPTSINILNKNNEEPNKETNRGITENDEKKEQHLGFGDLGKKAFNVISDIFIPPLPFKQNISPNIENSEVLFDFANPNFNQLFTEDGGIEIKNKINKYSQEAKKENMKFLYPELVQKDFHEMDSLFEKVEIQEILALNEKISSILLKEDMIEKYKKNLNEIGINDYNILEKLQEEIKPITTLSKDKYSSFQKEFSVVLIEMKENHSDSKRLNIFIKDALDKLQQNDVATLSRYSTAACQQLLNIIEVLRKYIDTEKVKQKEFQEGKINPSTHNTDDKAHNTIAYAKNIGSICILLLKECKFITFEFLNCYYMIYQYIENFNLIQNENPNESNEKMPTPNLEQVKFQVKYNKNLMMSYLEQALTNIHSVFIDCLPILQLLTIQQTRIKPKVSTKQIESISMKVDDNE